MTVVVAGHSWGVVRLGWERRLVVGCCCCSSVNASSLWRGVWAGKSGEDFCTHGRRSRIKNLLSMIILCGVCAGKLRGCKRLGCGFGARVLLAFCPCSAAAFGPTVAAVFRTSKVVYLPAFTIPMDLLIGASA